MSPAFAFSTSVCALCLITKLTRRAQPEFRAPRCTSPRLSLHPNLRAFTVAGGDTSKVLPALLENMENTLPGNPGTDLSQGTQALTTPREPRHWPLPGNPGTDLSRRARSSPRPTEIQPAADGTKPTPQQLPRDLSQRSQVCYRPRRPPRPSFGFGLCRGGRVALSPAEAGSFPRAGRLRRRSRSQNVRPTCEPTGSLRLALDPLNDPRRFAAQTPGSRFPSRGSSSLSGQARGRSWPEQRVRRFRGSLPSIENHRRPTNFSL